MIFQLVQKRIIPLTTSASSATIPRIRNGPIILTRQSIKSGLHRLSRIINLFGNDLSSSSLSRTNHGGHLLLIAGVPLTIVHNRSYGYGLWICMPGRDDERCRKRSSHSLRHSA